MTKTQSTQHVVHVGIILLKRRAILTGGVAIKTILMKIFIHH